MAYLAKMFDELEACYPDTDVRKGESSYQVDCCNGTYAGVNIMISGLEPGLPVAVSVKGPHTGHKLFKMVPAPVEVNTGAKMRTEYLKNDYNKNVIRRAPFMVYDALVPVYNVMIADTSVLALNFKSIVEYTTNAHDELWEIYIEHGGYTSKLEFTVSRYPIDIPKTRDDEFKYINWINYENIAKYHNIVLWSEDYFRMLHKYMRVAVHSRQNMVNLPIKACFERTSSGIKFNEGRLERIVQIAKEAGIKYFNGDAWQVDMITLKTMNNSTMKWISHLYCRQTMLQGIFFRRQQKLLIMVIKL